MHDERIATKLSALDAFKLDGSVAFVTGAGGQLGLEIIQTLHQLGAKVILADANADAAQKAFENLSLDKNQALSVGCDIRNRRDVAAAMDAGNQAFGEIDLLINNAGVSVFEDFLERPEESIDWVMDVNLKGTVFCIQEFVRRWKGTRGQGCIVNIASHYGLISPDPRIYTDCQRKNSEIYGATKAGVIQMTRYFAVHLASKKIRVNCISPGGIFNPKSPQGPDFVARYSERCPLGRMALSHEIQGAIAFLASPASSYVNGHNLVLDGGMSAW